MKQFHRLTAYYPKSPLIFLNTRNARDQTIAYGLSVEGTFLDIVDQSGIQVKDGDSMINFHRQFNAQILSSS